MLYGVVFFGIINCICVKKGGEGQREGLAWDLALDDHDKMKQDKC